MQIIKNTMFRQALFFVALAVLTGAVVGWIGEDQALLLKSENLWGAFIGGTIAYTVLGVGKGGSFAHVFPRVMIPYGVVLAELRLASAFGIYYGAFVGLLAGLFLFVFFRWAMLEAAAVQHDRPQPG
jgi:hypothetical protein